MESAFECLQLYEPITTALTPVVVGEPVLSGYLRPDEAHVPFSGASASLSESRQCTHDAVLTDRHEVAIYDRTLQVKVPADLVERGAIAIECGRDARRRLQCRRDGRQGISLATRRGDACSSQPLIGREALLTTL